MPDYGHFWTTDEKGEGLDANLWKLEGPACRVLPVSAASQALGAIPFYRFWKADKNIHFWTTSENGEGVVNDGFIKEGPACFVFRDQREGTTPLYRFFGQGYGHFWTTDIDGERLPKTLFKRESVACYVFTSGNNQPGLAPFYRFWEPTYPFPSDPPPPPPIDPNGWLHTEWKRFEENTTYHGWETIRALPLVSEVHIRVTKGFGNGLTLNDEIDLGQPASGTDFVRHLEGARKLRFTFAGQNYWERPTSARSLNQYHSEFELVFDQSAIHVKVLEKTY